MTTGSRQIGAVGARRIVRAAWTAWLLTLLVGAAWIPLLIGNGPAATTATGIADICAAIFAFQSMATIGLLIVRSDPRNAEGWLFCVAPVLMTAGNALGAYAEHALLHDPDGGLPGGAIASALSNTWLMGATLFISFLVLLFPDGRLPGPRWRPVGWIGAVSLAALWFGLLVTPGPLDAPLQRFENPLGVSGVQYLAVGGLAVPLFVGAGVLGAIIRYRRGTSAERRQLRLFLTAVCLVLALAVADLVLEALLGTPSPPAFVVLLFMSLVPASVGVAILRHRLYDIDLIVRRTLVYGVLLAVLAAGYLGGIALLGWALRTVAHQGSTVAVTVSTLAVAAAFQPLRRRIQASVDRRFYRGKYDSAAALAGFGNRVRDQIDLDALHSDVLAVVQRTLQPAQASLWLRDRGLPERGRDGSALPVAEPVAGSAHGG